MCDLEDEYHDANKAASDLFDMFTEEQQQAEYNDWMIAMDKRLKDLGSVECPHCGHKGLYPTSINELLCIKCKQTINQ